MAATNKTMQDIFSKLEKIKLQNYDDLPKEKSMRYMIDKTQYFCICTGSFIELYNTKKINNDFSPKHPAKRTGFKVHINVHKDFVKNAFNSIFKLLISNKSPIIDMKISNIDFLIKSAQFTLDLVSDAIERFKINDISNTDINEHSKIQEIMPDIPELFENSFTISKAIQYFDALPEDRRSLFSLALSQYKERLITLFERCIENAQFTIYISDNVKDQAYVEFFQLLEQTLKNHNIAPASINPYGDTLLTTYLSGRYDNVLTSSETYISALEGQASVVPQIPLFTALQQGAISSTSSTTSSLSLGFIHPSSSPRIEPNNPSCTACTIS